MVCAISMDWVYRGMRTLIIENEFLRTVVILDKGSDIMEMKYKPKDLNLLLEREEGHRDPKRLIGLAPFDHGMEDLFGGGWNECLPNAGSPCTYEGVPHSLHGEVPLSPFDCVIEEERRDTVRARLSLKMIRYPLELTKWIELRGNEKALRIKEKLVNLSSEDLEFSWLHHPNFGPPFLEPDCRVVIKGGVVRRPSSQEVSKWPNVTSEKGEVLNLSLIPNKNVRLLDVYFISDMLEPWYSLYNPKLKVGIAVRWNPDVFKHIWFWRNFWGSGYPWYGRLWNIGLEFCTSIGLGLADQVKNCTAATIKGNSSVSSNIIASVYEKEEQANEFSEEGVVR